MGTESLKTAAWDIDLPDAWRTMRSAAASGAYNMALDAALLATARDRGVGVWRTYAWERPTISFGRNELVQARFDPESLALAGLDSVRRPTGGRALLHAAEVTYSVALPIADRTPWTAVYAAINVVLLTALRHLGVRAELASGHDTRALRPDGPVCFDRPAQGEIVVGEAKLVGSAVWRERGAYLQHGSILLEDSQHLVRAAMRAPQPAPPPAASLSTCLPHTPTWDTVATALERALRDCVLTRQRGAVDDHAIHLDASTLARLEMHFRDPAWLWRR